MPTILERRDIAVDITAEASQMALSFFHKRGQFGIESKGAHEFVTEADRLVEEFVRHRLARALPGDAVHGEEAGGQAGEAFWSVDPIDGTSNFLRGSPLWGVSLGYMEAGAPQVGVICFPVIGITLDAALGFGVRLQGQRFQRDVPFQGVRVAAVGDSTLWPVQEIDAVSQALRASGSAIAQYRCASIGLGFAALGYTDGYIEQNLSVWDLAAGVIICREAGLTAEFGGTYKTQDMWVRVGVDSVHQATSVLVPSAAFTG